MIAATKEATPAQRCAGGRYARLDEQFLLEIRPYLTDSEARVYELLVLKCDGWRRPTNPATIAALARIHTDTARRVIRRLEEIGLIRSHWSGARQSPSTERTVEIVRDYQRARSVLQTAESEVSEAAAHGIEPSHDMGSSDPMRPDPAIPSHLIARSLSRSDPDLPSLPSLPPLAPTEVERSEKEGRRKADAVGLADTSAATGRTDTAAAGLTDTEDAAGLANTTAATGRTDTAAAGWTEITAAGLTDTEDTASLASAAAAAGLANTEAEAGSANTEPEANEVPRAARGSAPQESASNLTRLEDTTGANAPGDEARARSPGHESSPSAPSSKAVAPVASTSSNANTEPPEPASADSVLAPGNRSPSSGRCCGNPGTPALAKTKPAPDDSLAVPDELVTVVRGLWGMNVAIKAARRYVGRLVAVGDPPATVEEIARYLRISARLPRVQRAGFPLAVLCVPEEFSMWLSRYRKLCVFQSTPPPQTVTRSPAEALSHAELGRRAQQFLTRRLGGAPPARDSIATQ